MIEIEAIRLSSLCDFNADYASPLKNEASGREYWRVGNKKESFILCYLDPDIGDHSDFINISESLKSNDIKAVNIIHHNYELGVTLQEDLGNDDLLTILNDANKEELLKKSIDLLVQIQNADIKNIKEFKYSDLVNQMNLCKDVFLKDFLNIKIDSLIDYLISLTIDKLKIHPWTNCHFDFERRNLILNKHKTITAIDYQDMKKGPIGIDMAGLLIDHYYHSDQNNIKGLLKYYSNSLNWKNDIIFTEEELFEFLRYGCLQRNMRILGTLANLYLLHGRSYRLKDLPMIFQNLVSMIPEEDIKENIVHKVQPILLERISQI